MIKTITKIGNSQGIILDVALMELARLKVGDEVNVTVHEGGSVMLTPVHPGASDPDAVDTMIRETARDYHRTLSRLA